MYLPLTEHEPSSLITDPVWPNVPEGMIMGHENPHELLSFVLGEAVPQSVKRLVIILRSDSDPRFLSAVPNRWPFFNAHWLAYAMPGFYGRILGGNEIAYAFGEPIPRREGQKVIPSVGPKAQPQSRAGIGHPCPRTPEHMEWLVRWWSEPGETIVDPFMGSGTMALAARKWGRKFVGVEIDRRWFDLAVERIRSLTTNGPLFETGPSEDSQKELL